MSLTPEQVTTLRTLVLNEPSLAQARNDANDQAIADWLNAAASPAFFIYKSRLSRHDIITGTSLDGTVFGWAGNLYISRAQGERDAFREMFNDTGEVNPALPTIQAAFNDIFSGAGGLPNRTHIQSMSRIAASRAQKQLATTDGTHTGTTALPAISNFFGQVTPSEASNMR